MAEDDPRAPLTTRTARFNGRAFLRLGFWSAAATVAVIIALAFANSEAGLRRFSTALSGMQTLTFAQRESAARNAEDMQRMAESLRQINSDRIRMVARLEAIEQHLDDLTGSINRNSAVASPNKTVTPPESSVATGSSNPAPSGTTGVAPGAIAALPSQTPAASSPVSQLPTTSPAAAEPATAEGPISSKIDFGVDVGGAQTVDGLRTLWTQVKAKHGTLLEGMRPIITIRESARPSATELRLVVGPLSSATLAARLCVAMNAAGALCQPAVFDGQRLALR